MPSFDTARMREPRRPRIASRANVSRRGAGGVESMGAAGRWRADRRAGTVPSFRVDVLAPELRRTHATRARRDRRVSSCSPPGRSPTVSATASRRPVRCTETSSDRHDAVESVAIRVLQGESDEEAHAAGRVDPGRDGPRDHPRLHDLHELPGQEGRRRDRRLHLDHVRRVPAADQDADRPARVLDARRRHRAHGRRVVGRARVRQGDRLVRHRVAGVARSSASILANLLQPGNNLGLPLPDIGASANLATSKFTAQGLRQPHGAEVVRRGDGQQRDPADRRVLDVLRRRARRRSASKREDADRT